MVILAQIARLTVVDDKRVSFLALFLAIRFNARHYIGEPLPLSRTPAPFIKSIPSHPVSGTLVFGTSLYEIMWCQRRRWPKLVVPYVLYYLINLLKQKDCLGTRGIFRFPGNDGATKSIRAEVDSDIKALKRGDVNVLANLLKLWLRELPNPVIPVEMTSEFETACRKHRYGTFITRLPQMHQVVLTYLIGFVKELAENAEATEMEQSDLASVFGPLIVNPVRSAKENSDRILKLTELSVGFFNKCLELAKTTGIYPLDEAYLARSASGRVGPAEGP
jgi:hypothetical protein